MFCIFQQGCDSGKERCVITASASLIFGRRNAELEVAVERTSEAEFVAKHVLGCISPHPPEDLPAELSLQNSTGEKVKLIDIYIFMPSRSNIRSQKGSGSMETNIHCNKPV